MVNKPTTVNEDANLGPEWVPLDVPPIIPGSSHGGPFPQPSPLGSFITAAISPSLQHDADFVKTAISSPGIPKYPLMPVAPSGTPSTNSGVQSVVAAGVSEFVSTGASGPTGAIQINESGVLYGDSGFTYDKSSQSVQIGGALSIGGALVITGGILITGNASVSGFINAGTGFQVGGAAASGHYLRGNGTDFISSVLNASDVSTGLLGVTYGGTGANLSATGGASQVLKQTTVGGVVTVAQLAAADLSNGATGSGAVVLAASPTLTGTPLAPTPTATDNSTKIATTAYVQNQSYSAVHIVVVTLSSAQLLALNSTPITLISALGSNKMIGPIAITWQYKAGATPYTLGNSDNVISIEYTGTSDVFASETALGFVDQTTSQINSGPLVGTAVIPETDVNNVGAQITLTGTTPALTLGNGTVTITLVYAIVSLT